MKADYQLKTNELTIARDSIGILINKEIAQNHVLDRLLTIIEIKDTIIDLKDSIILQRGLQIDDLNKNNATLKKQRNRAVGVSSTFGIILTIIILVAL